MFYDLIVIGGGPCGYEAAIHAAKNNKKILLVETKAIGGTCLNEGCIPTKTLLRSVHVYKNCKQCNQYGIEFQNDANPIFNLIKVQERKESLINLLAKGILSQLKALKVDIVYGNGKIINPQTVEIENVKYETENILIATGSKAVQLPFIDYTNSCIINSTQVLSLKTLPSSIVIVGGGVIGLEFAAFFAGLNIPVTVIEMAPRIAINLDQDITKRLMAALQKEKVVFHLEAKLQAINNHIITYIDNKGNTNTIESELILIATGRQPNFGQIDLDKLGIEYTKKGIIVNEQGKTNIPHIWAAGDVTGRCLLAHSAIREGIVAVDSMFGSSTSINHQHIPSVIYTQPEVACVGMSEQEAKNQNIKCKVITVPMGVAGRFPIEYAGESGLVKVLFDETTEQIIGIHMIGGGCGEFVCAATIIIEKKLTAKQIEEIIFPHPTVSEALKMAISKYRS